jgi:hypothetical protein
MNPALFYIYFLVDTAGLFLTRQYFLLFTLLLGYAFGRPLL